MLRAAAVVAATAALAVGVVACSDGGTTATIEQADTPTAVGPDPALPLRDYYLALGVSPTIVDCYVDALTDLGVTSVLQLEQDQALGSRAADLFETCTAAMTP